MLVLVALLLAAAGSGQAAATATALTINSQVTPSVFGQAVVFSGTVTAVTGSDLPTGTVNVQEGTAVLGTSPVDGKGNYQVSVSTLAVGNHGITAAFVATGSFASSVSLPVTQVVKASQTSTTLQVSPQAPALGQNINFSAVVAIVAPGSGVPAGTVTFFDGITAITSAPLPSTGTASAVQILAPGTHQVSATFTPSDGNTQASTSAAVNVTVGGGVSMTLTTAPLSPTLGTVTTLTVRLTASGTPPTGTVTFSDGGVALSTNTLSAGQASTQTTFHTVGSHNITVKYDGDVSHSAASVTAAVNVTRGVTQLSLATGALSILYGQTLTLTAQLNPQPAGIPGPSGLVTFLDGNTTLGTAAPSASGAATFALPTLAGGAHNLTASYIGDTNWQPAQSTVMPLTVLARTTFTLASLSANLGQEVTVSVSVTAQGLPVLAPTGSVQLVDTASRAVLGSFTLTAGVAVAAITLTAANPIQAVYTGNPNFATSSSLPVPVVYTMNAAGAATPNFAAEELISLFGSGFTVNTASAPSIPLPLALAGASINVLDSAGVNRPAPLTYVSPTQINAMIPSGTATGAATMTVDTVFGKALTVQLNVNPTAPGIFTANSDGRGVAAAQILRVAADGTQTVQSIASYDAVAKQWVPAPIDLSTDAVYLVLFGTGLRNTPVGSLVTCTLKGVTYTPVYAGAQNEFPGLDQIDLLLPPSLSGSGLVTVQVIANLQPANPVTIAIK